MIDNGQALELIEQAQTASPFCGCGRQTIAVGRGGGVWLECSSLQGRPRTMVRRLLAEIGVHTRELIVDLTPDSASAPDQTDGPQVGRRRNMFLAKPPRAMRQ